MQQALCLYCGAVKDKPLDACSACSRAPELRREQAQHLLAATFNFTAAQFASAQELIRNGGELEFDPDAMMTAEGALKADKPDAHWLLFWFVIVLPLVLLVMWFLVFADNTFAD